ncbi:LysE family translocator [Azospirillum argentinense]
MDQSTAIQREVMMPIEAWLAFTAASAVLLIIPGPTILLVVSYALGQGRRSGLATVVGVALGDFTAMTASMLGLGVVLAASSLLFTALKWIGAAYLVYLGLKLWRSPVVEATSTEPAPAVPPFRMALHTYAVTALNPKSIVFFVAFLPQFVDSTQPLLPQILIMEATFLVLATLNATLYALLASAAGQAVQRPSIRRIFNRTGGAMLIGAGIMTAAWRRTAS